MRAAILAFAALLPGSSLIAQTRPPVEPFFPLDHWTRAALRRLAGTGDVSAGDALAVWPLPGERVRTLFEARADTSDVAHGFLEKLRDDRGTGAQLHASIDAGWAGHGDRLRAGVARPVESGPAYPGPLQLDDDSRLAYGAALSGRLADRFLLAASVRDTAPGEWQVQSAYAALRAGPFNVRLGRQPYSFGVAHDGGLVLHSPPPFDGLHADIAEGFTLPWIFRYAGPVRIAQLVALMDRSGTVDDPWFAATRITFSPWRPLTVGFQRAVILGGEGGTEPVTARRVLLALLGVTDTPGKDSDFENQVVSGDLFWKLPDVPASIHVEWSFDDAGAAFHAVPGFAFGADWHVLPFAPALGAGLEVVLFTPSVRAHPPWYQHTALGDGWTVDGHPMGHPLGGHGREVALTLLAAPPNLQLESRLFWRDRGDENLFAPDREGESVGVRLNGAVWLGGPWRLHTRLDAERHSASGWSWSADLAAGVELPFSVTRR